MTNQCMNVPIVYDWLSVNEKIKRKQYIRKDNKVNAFCDQICIDFTIDCENDSPTIIWKAVGMKVGAATFTIDHPGSCTCDFDVFVNNNKIATIGRNSNFNGTVGNAETISVSCSGNCLDSAICQGKLIIKLHYLVDCRKSEREEVTCFISDEFGNPMVDSCGLTCKELIKSKQRKYKSFLIEDGSINYIQQVTILITGYLTLKINRSDGDIICIFPLCVMKNYLLCAPFGTQIKCNISNINCEVIKEEEKKCGSKLKTEFIIDFCLDIQSVYHGVVNISAQECEPRNILPLQKSCINSYKDIVPKGL